MTPSQQQITEAATGAGGIFALALASPGFEAWGILAGGLALFFLRESVPWRRRSFYALASMAIGTVFAPGLSDLASHFWPSFPSSLRPAIGFMAVCAAVPFATLWRAGWRHLADHPELLWDWLSARFSRRRGRAIQREDDDGQS